MGPDNWTNDPLFTAYVSPPIFSIVQYQSAGLSSQEKFTFCPKKVFFLEERALLILLWTPPFTPMKAANGVFVLFCGTWCRFKQMQAHGSGSPESRMLHVAIPGDYSTLSSTRDRVEGWNCQIYWWIYMACWTNAESQLHPKS